MRYEDLTNNNFNLIDHLINDNERNESLIKDDDDKFIVGIYIRNYGFNDENGFNDEINSLCLYYL